MGLPPGRASFFTHRRTKEVIAQKTLKFNLITVLDNGLLQRGKR
jgi:hypothetical protein